VGIPSSFFAIYKDKGKDENLFLSIVESKRFKNLNKESIATFDNLNRCWYSNNHRRIQQCIWLLLLVVVLGRLDVSSKFGDAKSISSFSESSSELIF
jgi:hypothetical protein